MAVHNSRRIGKREVKRKTGNDRLAMPCITDAMIRKADVRKQEFYTVFDLYAIVSPYYYNTNSVMEAHSRKKCANKCQSRLFAEY
ncbi:unnamed protein product [Clavelina lepadiformis]|uniref:Uncharacterized protein n=1 Tax=Clavelina lepadiformis TaxID=159417 RepID=A0ABP0G3W9_CLALP